MEAAWLYPLSTKAVCDVDESSFNLEIRNYIRTICLSQFASFNTRKSRGETKVEKHSIERRYLGRNSGSLREIAEVLCSYCRVTRTPL